ncbi:MAG: hypothetical protein KJ760_19185 [Proteobacteria bacterium]|nr:hypothetical protein [Pseudomonadota bacterium]
MPLNPIASGKYGVCVPAEHNTVITTSVSILAGKDAKQIGFAQEINEDLRRPVTPIRHLSSVDAGKILELAPGVEDITLSVAGFAIYDIALGILNQLGYDSMKGSLDPISCLNQQCIPFNVVKLIVHPGSGKSTTTLFLGCMITSFSEPIALSGVTISNRVDITAISKEVRIGSEGIAI